MADYVLFVVCCLWLIPNGMNNTGCMAFSTELYCLRQNLQQRPPVIFGLFLPNCIACGKVIPQRIIANIFLGHNIEMHGVNGYHMESR
jgi:hypothetical protein